MNAIVKSPSQQMTVRRIRFVAPSGVKPLRSFTQPRPCAAVEESLSLVATSPATFPEWTDQLDVMIVTPGTGGAPSAWLNVPEHPDAQPAIVVERSGGVVEWRPGRAVVRADSEHCDDLITALVEFAYYEGELRALERGVEAVEVNSAADTARAYRIRPQDSEHWPRFASLMEQCGRLRLNYVRLAPRLAKPSRSMSPEARRVVARLLAKADVPARLEAISERLEACEDLYEGATDRVADYKWYRTGHRLEWGIIFLLIMEVMLMSADLYVRYLDYSDPGTPETSQQESASKHTKDTKKEK
jgi:hypothetical protein